MRKFALPLVTLLAVSACEQPQDVVSPMVDVDIQATLSPTSSYHPNPILTPPSYDTEANGPQMAAPYTSQPVPAEVIVNHDGLEWVWASPCAEGGCTSGLLVGKEDFVYATQAQWDRLPPVSAFHGKCASRYFDLRYNHCDQVDLDRGDYFGWSLYGSAVSGGTPAGANNLPMHPVGETILVRESGPQTKDDCKKGGWEQYGFRNQGQCVRYIETGKDSR